MGKRQKLERLRKLLDQKRRRQVVDSFLTQADLGSISGNASNRSQVPEATSDEMGFTHPFRVEGEVNDEIEGRAQ